MLFGSTSFETFFGLGLKETKDFFSGKDINFSSFMDNVAWCRLKNLFCNYSFHKPFLMHTPFISLKHLRPKTRYISFVKITKKYFIYFDNHDPKLEYHQFKKKK